MLINPLIHINPTGWMTIPASPIYPIYHVLTMAWVCPKMRDAQWHFDRRNRCSQTSKLDIFLHFLVPTCVWNLLKCHFPYHQNLKAFGNPGEIPLKRPAGQLMLRRPKRAIQSAGRVGDPRWSVFNHGSRLLTHRSHRKSPFFLVYPIWKWANYGY